MIPSAIPTPWVFGLLATCVGAFPLSSASPVSCQIIHYACPSPGNHVNFTTTIACARPGVLLANQRESLQCSGSLSPSPLSGSPLTRPEAWEALPSDLVDVFGLAAPSYLTQNSLPLFRPSPIASSCLLLPWTPTVGLDSMHAYAHDLDICPSSASASASSSSTISAHAHAAPATYPRRTPSSVCPRGSRPVQRSPSLKLADTTHKVTGHHHHQSCHHRPPHQYQPHHEYDTGRDSDRHAATDLAPDSGPLRSFIGAVYHSFALWELASFMSAIAWLLVCLAA